MAAVMYSHFVNCEQIPHTQRQTCYLRRASCQDAGDWRCCREDSVDSCCWSTAVAVVAADRSLAGVRSADWCPTSELANWWDCRSAVACSLDGTQYTLPSPDSSRAPVIHIITNAVVRCEIKLFWNNFSVSFQTWCPGAAQTWALPFLTP